MQDMEQIYEQYFETVYKYLFCLTRNSDISEELTQETFYRAVKRYILLKVTVKYLYGYARLLKTYGMMNAGKIEKI